MKKFLLLAAAGSLMLSGCARDMSSASYVSSDSMGVVVEGTVLSARAVRIKEAERLQDNGLGGVAGGVAGGVGANALGKGSGKTAATVGGVIAGAVAGALIQSALSESDGMEYIVKIAQKNQAGAKGNKDQLSIGGNSMADKIKNSIDTNMTSDTVSVIQGKDPVFTVGQHVYVIYNNNKARLVAAN